MFLRRIRLPLVGKHLKTTYQAHTGYGRIDHLVHVAQPRQPGRGWQTYCDSHPATLYAWLRCRQLCQSLYGKECSPLHRDPSRLFRQWISQIHISPDVLGTHYIISSAISFTGNHRDLRHRSFTIGIKQLWHRCG